MIIRRASLAAVLAFSLAACGGDDQPAGVIPREKFVAANVELRSLPDGATPEQRAAVLRKHGVTEGQMNAWVNGNARNPGVLARAWEEIAFKLDSAGNPSSMPHPPSSTPPAGRVPPPRPAGMAPPDSVMMAPPPPPPAAAEGEPRRRAPRPKRIREVQ